VLGTVVDFLGQQVTAALNLVLTLASPLPATLAQYITQLAPQHLWKWDETFSFVPDTVFDTGSATADNMTLSSGAFTSDNPGPDTLNSTKSFSFVAGPAARCIDNGITPALGTSAVGSFVWFIKKNTGFSINNHNLFVTDTSAVNQQMRVGISAGKPFLFFVPTPGNAMQWDADVAPFTANDTWQMMVWVQANDGTGPKLYVNGTLRSITGTPQGTPPPNNYWFADCGNTRAQFFAGNWGAGNEQNPLIDLSSTFIIDRVLTTTEMTNLMSYLPTP
jgi:hypothetical protein